MVKKPALARFERGKNTKMIVTKSMIQSALCDRLGFAPARDDIEHFDQWEIDGGEALRGTFSVGERPYWFVYYIDPFNMDGFVMELTAENMGGYGHDTYLGIAHL